MVFGQLQAPVQLGQIQSVPDLLLLRFQLFHAGLGGVVEDAGFDCSHDVLQGSLDLPQIGLESIGVGCVGIGFHIILIGVFCDEVQQVLIQKQELGLPQDKTFDPLFFDVFLSAGAAGLFVIMMAGAGIIVVFHFGRAVATDPAHLFSTTAAEQFPRQKVICLGPLVRRRPLVKFQHLLGLLKHFHVDDGGDAALDTDLTVVVGVDPDVFFVFQQGAETVAGKRLASQRPQTLFVQALNDLRLRLTIGVALEDLAHDGGLFRVDLEAFVWTDTVPQGAGAAGALAFGCTDPVPPADVLRELEGVILRHAL